MAKNDSAEKQRRQANQGARDRRQRHVDLVADGRRCVTCPGCK